MQGVKQDDMPLTRGAARTADDEAIDLCSVSETTQGKDPVPQVVRLSAEEDTKYAAVLNFCDRLSQLGHEKRGEFERVGIESVFGELLGKHPRGATRENLHLIWFLLGTAAIRANSTCRRITRDLDNQTAKVILQDKSELRDLRAELACVVQDEKAHDRDRRVSRLECLIVGKQKMIVAEARKVELLYGLLGPKQRTYSKKFKQEQRKRTQASRRVESLVGPFLWD